MWKKDFHGIGKAAVIFPQSPLLSNCTSRSYVLFLVRHLFHIISSISLSLCVCFSRRGLVWGNSKSLASSCSGTREMAKGHLSFNSPSPFPASSLGVGSARLVLDVRRWCCFWLQVLARALAGACSVRCGMELCLLALQETCDFATANVFYVAMNDRWGRWNREMSALCADWQSRTGANPMLRFAGKINQHTRTDPKWIQTNK